MQIQGICPCKCQPVWSNAAFATLFLPLITLCGRRYSCRHVLSSCVSAARLWTHGPFLLIKNNPRGLQVQDSSAKQTTLGHASSRRGHYPHSPVTKYLGQIGFTMIQIAYQIHEKLSASLLQQKHPHEPSPLTSASNQNTHMRTSGCHYDASTPF